MRDTKIVHCDTGFIIRLINEDDDCHNNAIGYLKYFMEHDYTLRISTIAIAEYCVKGEFEQIPLRYILVSPFNINHALHTSKCARVLFENKAKGVNMVGNRHIIQNDVKIMAQAEQDQCQYYLTSDAKSKRMYDVLRENNLVGFDFIDIHNPWNLKFGELDMSIEQE